MTFNFDDILCVSYMSVHMNDRVLPAEVVFKHVKG